MHFMPVTMDVNLNDLPENHYIVVHPLDDIPEKKVDTEKLGPMPMTTSVKLSLLALRSYLVVTSGTYRPGSDYICSPALIEKKPPPPRPVLTSTHWCCRSSCSGSNSRCGS